MTHPAPVGQPRPRCAHVERVEASDTGRGTRDSVGVNCLRGCQRSLTPMAMVPHSRPYRAEPSAFPCFWRIGPPSPWMWRKVCGAWIK